MKDKKYWIIFIVLVIAILLCFKFGCFVIIFWEGSIVKKAIDKLCEYREKREAKYETGITPKDINRC